MVVKLNEFSEYGSIWAMGGLVIIYLPWMNHDCTVKIGWQLRNGDNNVWCKILHSKYARGNIDERTLISDLEILIF